jgi:predicted choloylglycine hydrolase
MQLLDTNTFDLSGTHYEIGYHIGQQSQLFTLPTWWPEPPPLSFAQSCAREIAAFHPTLLDELYGHADGQAQDYDHLLRILCRYRLGGRPASVPEQGGCTSLAWRAPNGHWLVGRNYDFYPVQRIRQRIRLAPQGNLATVGMRGSVPCGRYDGVNHAGLFCSLHIVLAERSDTVPPGIPFHLIPRILLETCANVREAISLLFDMPHIHSFNYLIADANECAVVECHSERVRIVYPENGLLAVGNFYQHPDMQPLQRHRRQEYSRERVSYLQSRSWEREDAWESIQTALTDHTHHVCGHTGGHTTLWSAMADLTAHRIAYTTSAPCEQPHAEVVWPA